MNFFTKFLFLFSFLLFFKCQNFEMEKLEIEKKGSLDTQALKSEYLSKFSINCVSTLYQYDSVENIYFPKEKAFGPPSGKGQYEGSTDVFVIGENNSAIFDTGLPALINQTGIEIKVFENSFEIFGSSPNMSWDLGFLEVSDNLTDWYGFKPTATGNPTLKDGKTNLIGLNFVEANFENLDLDPFSNLAGGDGFDLENAYLITDRIGGPLNYTYGSKLTNGIRYIKVIDGGNAVPDNQVASNGIDIDAICFKK